MYLIQGMTGILCNDSNLQNSGFMVSTCTQRLLPVLLCPRAHSVVYPRFFVVVVLFNVQVCCLVFFCFVCLHSVSSPMLPVYLDCLFFSKVYLLFMFYTCYYARSFLHIYQTKLKRKTINTHTSMYDIKTGKVHS